METFVVFLAGIFVGGAVGYFAACLMAAGGGR